MPSEYENNHFHSNNEEETIDNKHDDIASGIDTTEYKYIIGLLSVHAFNCALPPDEEHKVLKVLKYNIQKIDFYDSTSSHNEENMFKKNSFSSISLFSEEEKSDCHNSSSIINKNYGKIIIFMTTFGMIQARQIVQECGLTPQNTSFSRK